jgi:hypothetical protein
MSNRFEAAVQIGKGIVQLGKTVAKKLKGNKQTFTGRAINTTKPGTQLTKKRKQQDDFVKFRDNLHTSSGFDKATKNKLKMQQPLYKMNKKTSDIFTPKEPKFNKGGRVGLKRGTGLRKKSNVEKIKKTFGAKKGLGMQSVIYGLDKNPNITAADPKAKFIAAANKKKKKKKKII